MLLRSQLVVPVQELAVRTHLGGVVFEMIPEGVVREGLTLEQVNLGGVENHMAVVRQVDLKVEDVGIIHLVQGGRVVQLAVH